MPRLFRDPSFLGRTRSPFGGCAPKGIILSGGPASVYALKAPQLDTGVYELGVPILGSAMACSS